MRSLNRDQRIALAVAWGIVLWRSAEYAKGRLWERALKDRWFNYAPKNTTIAFVDGFPHAPRYVWVDLIAVVLWLIGALLLLRSPRMRAEPPVEDPVTG